LLACELRLAGCSVLVLAQAEDPTRTENVMGILDLAGEIAGAPAAVEGAEKLDPNAGLLSKGVAAHAGFKGAGAIASMAGRKQEQRSNELAPDADAAPQT
jgi:hypothetical protein